MQTVQPAKQSNQRRQPRTPKRKDLTVTAIVFNATEQQLAVLHRELTKHTLMTLMAERRWCLRWQTASCLVDLYWDLGDDEPPIEIETIRVRATDSDEYLRELALRVANSWHERLSKRAGVIISNDPQPEHLARVLKRAMRGHA